MDRLELPLTSDAPAGISVSVQADGLPTADVGGGRPDWRFQEQTAYDVFIEGVGEGVDLQAWVSEQEQTLRRVGGGAYWPLNWGGYVGLSCLRVEVDGQTVLDLPVEVRSRKLGYEDDYRRLLDELADWLAALAFSFATPTTLPTVVETADR